MLMPLFFIVLKTELLPVQVSDDASIFEIVEYLKSTSGVARRIFGRTSYEEYEYYLLNDPVPLPGLVTDSVLAATVQACLDKRKWEAVSSRDTLAVLVPTLVAGNVYLVIQPRSDPTQIAIAGLEANHADIFSCLQITVANLQRWTMEDVQNNLQGGRLWRSVNLPHDDYPAAIVEIEKSLAQRRTFNLSPAQASANKDLKHAYEHDRLFSAIYEKSDVPVDNVTDREFATFFHVVRCFAEDSTRIMSDGSSAMKASNFIVYFISPAFFSSFNQHFEFKQENAWDFPIFVSTRDQPNAWCQFRPRSDFMVSSRLFLCPFLISEVVVSQVDEKYRYRMLLQAIAVARAGQYLSPAGSQFFVVAIYLRANLIAERYIVAQITPKGKDNKDNEGRRESEESQEIEQREVHISQKDFDLTTAGGAVAFLCEMYNLVALVEKMAADLDHAKKDSLLNVNMAASKVISLSSKAAQRQPTLSASTSIPEGSGDEAQDDFGVFGADDLSVFGADDIQALLRRLNYKINFILFGFPLIASVSNVSDESEKGYLKFVEEGRKEISILQYLAGINSPANHTISEFRIWPVCGGNVVLMPGAGGWLTSLEKPTAHLLSVAQQLFEGVGFMHQHGVAHMDLKPQNILIPPAGGRVVIIDFDTSLRVEGIGQRFCGSVGTIGYSAPEVAAGGIYYSAIRADLWSCGKTVEELCRKCRKSQDRDTLLEICGQLMDEDPEKRPTMSDVLERLAPGPPLSC